MSDCKPIVSRKFIKTGSTEFDVLMGDGSVKDIRDLETFHGEHTILGTTIPTVTLLRFLESWGSFTNTGSSVYIKMTDTIIPDGETGIGDIPLGKSLIITYRVDCQTLMWVHADNGAVYKYRNYIWSVDSVNPAIYIATSEIGNTVPGLIDGLLDPSVIPNLPSEIVYGFTFDDLLLLDTKQGDILYIDLNTRIQYYWDDTSFVPYGTVVDFATKAEAESGTVIAKVMSPKTTKDAIEYHKATANILGSSTLNATSTNNTGTSTKTARQDHSHKVEGFSLTGHTHNNVLLHRPLTGDVVNMGTNNVIPIDATTFRKKNPSDFADHRQGELADTSIQDVKIGGVSTKKLQDGKFIATLSKYPENKDFRLRELKDVPTPIVTNKVLVTTSNDGFEFKDYKSTLNYPTELTNLPTISINAVSPTELDLTPQTLNGNLVLHPIARFGTLTTLSDVDSDPAPAENNILQYKNGIWTPSVPSGFDLKGLLFDTSGEGECCGAAYDGRTDLTISYNSIGASPLNHNHNLVNLNDVTVTDVIKDQILVYDGSKWVNELKTNISSLTFNNGGQGASSIAVYNGASPKTISYNTIGAAPSVHTHNLAALTDVLFGELAADDILQYKSGKWINTPLVGGVGEMENLVFNDLGSAPGGGGSPVINYNGTSSKIISFNTIGAAGLSHIHGNITNDGRIGNTPDLIVKTSTNGALTTLSKGTLGQFLGYDGKWATPSNQLKNITFSNNGSGDASTVLYNGSENKNISYNTIGAAPLAHTHEFNDITTVQVDNPVGNQVLKYDSGTNKWINSTLPEIGANARLLFNTSGGVTPGNSYDGQTETKIDFSSVGAAPLNHNHNLDTIGQVTITNPLPNQLLQYSNGAWVNSSVAGISNHTHDLDSLTDVRITTPQEGQLVTYHSGEWINSSVAGISNFIYDIAFVHKDGYDAATARIGDINKPFANLQDAINAVVVTNHLVSSIIYIMSDLSITEPIFLINDITITINLIDGVIVEYKNDNTPYTPKNPPVNEISNSLFNIDSSGKLIITSNGVGTFKCIEGLYGNSFATLGSMAYNYNATLELQNIIIEHIGTVIQLDGHTRGHLSTIICRNNSLLKINNCHILTYNTIDASDINCHNILLDDNNIVELNDSKLTILNLAYSGRSRHIFNIDRETIVSLFNCQTIQILKNKDLSTLTNWSVAVVGTELNGAAVSSHTISNCKFYIGNTINNRNVSTMVRVMSGASHATVITISAGDTIEYLGTSLHNYGNNFHFPEVTPIQYGGLVGTSLIRCPLLQPYEINYVI